MTSKFSLTIFAFLFLTSMHAQQDGFTAKWSNGFKLESADKNFRLAFGGRIMFDMAYFHQDGALEDEFGELNSGVEFRRARLFTSGTVYRNVKFKLQVDFTGGDATFKDMYIQLAKIPGIGNLRVGHFKEPFRLEALTSSKYMTFMERSSVAAVSRERNTGLMIFNDHFDSRFGWQLGVFRNADDFGSDEKAGGKYILTGRVTGLLLNDEEKKQLIHIGVGFSTRDAADDEFKLSIRPSAHLAPKYVSTGTLKQVNNIKLINGEAALVFGAFSVQGEYLSGWVSMDPVAEAYNYSAWYGQVSYFITGEHRPFKSSYDGFNRVKPKNNFGNKEGGAGAWEVAVRYGSIDLDDSPVAGGVLNDLTIGINWHLNPVTRVMTNYVLADVKDQGRASIVQMRFQIDF